MEDTSENKKGGPVKKPSKHLTVGLLAHVDAGKTTLSEGILYLSGSIRKMGRVDHKDAFLDTYAMERERGITIFSKQAVFQWGDREVCLLDTPGHIDFSAEMERTLQVLDYAVLVINGADGVQGHTETLWKLLCRYQIPTFLFINKMDQPGTDREQLLEELQNRLSDSCIDFSGTQEEKVFQESLAMCDEELLEKYLSGTELRQKDIVRVIAERKVFPCYFGSALKLEGVKELLDGLASGTAQKEYPAQFGAKVFKIARDEQGARLSYLKVTGGTLRVKTLLDEGEKVNQIRVYSGSKYIVTDEAEAGTVCAVTGLNHTAPGQGLGIEPMSDIPLLVPVLNYRIQLPPECDAHRMFLNLKELEEEEPELQVVWNETLQELHVQLMGEVQIEILKSLIWERFHVEVEFGEENVVYKETIDAAVEGVGHFEPLRHYAEVHLLLEPGERGSGLQFASSCSEDVLDRNWQRLILSHLEEREHPGVLTGSPVTDMKITLLTGRAHKKHTEGGDFRQATYRAVRQGLKSAVENKDAGVLLEPWYHFRLELPAECIGRAMSDIRKRSGRLQEPQQEGEKVVLEGSCPVVTLRGYQQEVLSYTGGKGRLSCSLEGYEPCHNQQEVVEAIGYDSEADTANPTGSVFCAHGSGFLVGWDKVGEYMHIDSCLEEESDGKTEYDRIPAQSTDTGNGTEDFYAAQKELDDIFERTYGPVRRRLAAESRTITAPSKKESEFDAEKWRRKNQKQEKQEEYLLVDGYNIIFAWKELRELAGVSLDSARTRLMDILCNYQGYQKCTLILVFDAYKVRGNPGSVRQYHNIYVVYTREAETADQYIEKTVHRIGRKKRVTVATSDGLEQMIILGSGAVRLSADNFLEEIERVNRLIEGAEEYRKED